MDPNFSFSGIASGIDTASIIKGLVQLERLPITRLEDQQEDLQKKQDKLNKIADLLGTLQTKASALDGRGEVLTSTGTSSQDDLVGVTVEGGASLGKFAVSVSNIATAQRTYSRNIAAKDQSGLFGTGTLDITVGSDATVSINVGASTTLEDVVSAINSSGARATAGLLFTGTEYYLQVTGNETGADNAITFGQTGTVDLNLTDTKQAALDANFTVDGFAMTSGSNLVTEAIAGVKLELKGMTTTDADVTIQRDPDALGDLLQEFVTAYNDADKQVAYELRTGQDATAKGSLFGESVVRQVQQKLRSTIVGKVSGLSEPYNYLGSIGVSIDRSGKLSLDRDKLKDALADDPEAVAKLLIDDKNAGTTGMMSLMDSTIDQLIDSSDGLLRTRTKGLGDRKRGLDDQISRMELRIDKYSEQLRNQFSAMEMALSSLQGQQAQLMSMMGFG